MFGRRDLASRLKKLGVEAELDSNRDIIGASFLQCEDPLSALRLLVEERALKVRSIDLTMRGSAAALACLGAFPLLETLNLSMCRELSGPDLRPLAALRNLKDLRLDGTKVGNEGLKHLNGLDLRALSLGPSLVDVDGLIELGTLRNLEKLQFYGNDIGDDGLARLASFPRLQELIVCDGSISDDGLEELKVLQELRDLNVGDNPDVGDKGMKYVGTMETLEDLGIYKTGVSDRGLKDLAGLKRLKSLNCMETRVTREGIGSLQKLLPGCKIDSPFF